MEDNKTERITKYTLADVVSKIEDQANQKSRLDTKFKLEYLIGNVTEQNLLDVGFTFKEYGDGNRCPIYELGNIIALFDDQILHVMEITA